MHHMRACNKAALALTFGRQDLFHKGAVTAHLSSKQVHYRRVKVPVPAHVQLCAIEGQRLSSI
jgi:hypothetical protein